MSVDRQRQAMRQTVSVGNLALVTFNFALGSPPQGFVWLIEAVSVKLQPVLSSGSSSSQLWLEVIPEGLQDGFCAAAREGWLNAATAPIDERIAVSWRDSCQVAGVLANGSGSSYSGTLLMFAQILELSVSDPWLDVLTPANTRPVVVT